MLRLLLVAGALVIAGCASGPRGGGAAGSADRDGPLPNPPPDLERVPDAEPRVEPLRSGGPNKPYEVAGRSYVPISGDLPLRDRGLASWYGRKFHGRPTASGEIYNMYAMTAAHPTMPLPSYARVRSVANGREVIVRVNDRGPFHSARVIDLSYTAALKLGLLRGVGIVEVERITYEEIRAGTWRRDGDRAVAQAAPTPAAVPAPAPALAPASALSPTPPPGPVPAPEAPTPAPEGPPAALPASAAAQADLSAPAMAVLAAPSAAPVVAPVAAAAERPGAYWVQLGVFRRQDGAVSFQRQVAAELDWLAPLLAIFPDSAVHRLQAGPYGSREEAASVANRVREALKLVPVVMQRR